MYTLTYKDGDAITELLMGHRMALLHEGWYVLDNGTELAFTGNKGPLARPWGTYALVARHSAMGDDALMPYVDAHVGPIAAVHLRNDPAGHQHPNGAGVYEVSVSGHVNGVLEQRRVVWFLGTDGDGNYGTGYTVRVKPHARRSHVGT